MTADRIRSLLADRDVPMTVVEIAEALGVGAATTQGALDALRRAGVVERERRPGGGQGGPYSWSLVRVESPDPPRAAPVTRLVRLPTPEVVAMRGVVEAARRLRRTTWWAELGSPGLFDDAIQEAIGAIFDAVSELEEVEERISR